MEKLENGTFGDEKEFPVLEYLHERGAEEKCIGRILQNFNNKFKDITENNVKNKVFFLDLLVKYYQDVLKKIDVTPGVTDRLNNYFVGKTRNFKDNYIKK